MDTISHFLIEKKMGWSDAYLLAPEIYLSNAYDALDDEGNFTNERTQKYLKKFVDALVEFAEGK